MVVSHVDWSFGGCPVEWLFGDSAIQRRPPPASDDRRCSDVIGSSGRCASGRATAGSTRTE